MAEKDFWKEMDYAMPEGTEEVKSETFDYYKHPLGVYLAIFGRATAKYKDTNGQKCEEGTPGSHISHFIFPCWITKYLGTTAEPVNKTVLEIKDGKLLIPTVKQAAELYYPLIVSYAPDMQWSVHQKFQSFHITGYDHLSIVRQNPAKPTEKITNFKAFPAYYGMQVKLVLQDKVSKGGKSFIDVGLELLTAPRFEGQVVKTIEDEIAQMIAKEIAERQSNKGDSSMVAPPPEANSLFNDVDAGEYGEVQ